MVWGCLRQEIFGGNLLKDVASQEILWIRSLSPNKIFKENPKQNALEYLAFGEGFIMDRLTARNLKQNLENNLYSSFATEGID